MFIGHGGGWGYSAHSVEAIRFCADADILLGGLGLFGGRGEYTAKIKVTNPSTDFQQTWLNLIVIAGMVELTFFTQDITVFSGL